MQQNYFMTQNEEKILNSDSKSRSHSKMIEKFNHIKIKTKKSFAWGKTNIKQSQKIRQTGKKKQIITKGKFC